MSIRALNEAWTLDLTPSQTLVLLAMVDHLDIKRRDSIRPGQKRIAWKTGLSHRQVRRTIHQLEALGVLEVVKPARWQYPAVYEFHPEKAAKKPPFRKDKVSPLRKDTVTPLDPHSGGTSSPSGGTFTTLRGDIYDTQGGHGVPQIPKNRHESSRTAGAIELKPNPKPNPKNCEHDWGEPVGRTWWCRVCATRTEHRPTGAASP